MSVNIHCWNDSYGAFRELGRTSASRFRARRKAHIRRPCIHTKYVKKPVRTVKYKYDEVVNRIEQMEDGKVTKYRYNALNELVQAGDQFYYYDANGNLVQKETKETLVKYKGVYYLNGSQVEYEYDALRRKAVRDQEGIQLGYKFAKTASIIKTSKNFLRGYASRLDSPKLGISINGKQLRLNLQFFAKGISKKSLKEAQLGTRRSISWGR
ncbi:hypothetical protein ACMW72_06640 [Tepidibacillus sp. LV47]